LLRKIETPETMTKRQAMEHYRDYYFHFVITEEIDRGDNDLGYVAYIYDNKREMSNIPREEFKGVVVAHSLGVAAEKGIHAGGVVLCLTEMKRAIMII